MFKFSKHGQNAARLFARYHTGGPSPLLPKEWPIMLITDNPSQACLVSMEIQNPTFLINHQIYRVKLETFEAILFILIIKRNTYQLCLDFSLRLILSKVFYLFTLVVRSWVNFDLSLKEIVSK